MPRVKRGVNAKKAKRKVFKAAKGYRGGRSKLLRSATEAVDRALCYAYAHRRTKKREMRRLWIARINAAARSNGISYSRLVEGLTKAEVGLDRKVLADMALRDPAAFTQITDIAKKTLSSVNPS
ncbi:LSU ribosomal protein L20p [hydrothermal vent metagenome]|uniref:LSU ribosomal protein L20p n=1 Tax=hydrothermal vent metagenome TaxID=652676 RepID=A0A3B0RMJ7_9ZZZZ